MTHYSFSLASGLTAIFHQLALFLIISSILYLPLSSAYNFWIGVILFELEVSRFEKYMCNIFISLISLSKIQISSNGYEFMRKGTFTTKCWSHISQKVREKSLNTKLVLISEPSARFGRCHFVHVTLVGCGCPLPYFGS